MVFYKYFLLVFWFCISRQLADAALENCDHISGEKGYCIPKESCNDPPSQNVTKCTNSKNPDFNICCKNITHRNKCKLWQSSAKSKSKNNTSFKENKNLLKTHKYANLFNKPYCGISSATGQNKIAFGNKTEIAQFPWVAILEYNFIGDEVREFNLCGGSLISENIVLTAAHCLKFSNCLELKSVHLGDHNVFTERDCEKFDLNEEWCAPPIQKISVKGYLVHKDYNKPKFANDIGLVQLAKAVKIDVNVKPICLPFGNNELQLDLVVIGFGLTDTGVQSAELLSAGLAYCPTEPCNNVYKDSQFSEKQFCAVGLGLEKVDSCQGDSGGPVQSLGRLPINNLPRMLQYGIVSGGINSCGQVESQPGVYTKVTEYIDWILDSIEALNGTTIIPGSKCSQEEIENAANKTKTDEYGNKIDINCLKTLACG